MKIADSNIHTRNLIFNWGGHGATLLVMFFLSPYIIGKLSAVSYGIWSLLNVLTGYMGVFDLGVRASVGRHVALYLGKNDEKGVDETIRAGFGFFSLTGTAILLLGVLLGWIFPDIFRGIPKEYHSIVRILLPLMVVNVWFSAVAAIYSSVLAAHDRFDVARGVDFAVLIVRTIGTIWFLHIGWGLWGLALSVMGGNMVAVVGNRICAGRHHRKLKSWPFIYSRERLGEIVNYGFAAFLSAASVKIIGQTDLVIAGAFLSVSNVREYSVGAMIVFYSSTFITIIGRTFFPVVQRSVAANRMEDARQFFYRQIHIAMFFGLLAYIGFASYSKPFIHLWMFQEGFGSEAVKASADVMRILAIAQFPLLYTRPSLNFLAAMGLIYFNARVSIIEALANLCLSLYFVSVLDWGLPGIAAGTLVSRFLIAGTWTPVYLFHRSGISLRSFISSTIFPWGLKGAGLIGLCVLLLWLWPPTTWTIFFSHIFLAAIFWSALSVSLFLPENYKKRVWNKLRKNKPESSVSY